MFSSDTEPMFSFIHIVYHISKKRTSVLFKNLKKGDVKVSNVTCGYVFSSAAIEFPRLPAFYPKKRETPHIV